MVPAKHPKHTQYVKDLGVVHDQSFAHPVELLTASVMELAPPQVIDDRYGLINRFEAGIVKHGTTIVSGASTSAMSGPSRWRSWLTAARPPSKPPAQRA
ncbi:MAG: hypothetical protein M3256_04820 [Actinomycetota bacterium]|nr:hypothetical protein [Candidatus Dormibacteraeota bacterium]MDQ6945595.1 hypothetical protein [Actinomycetota bacterium]